MVDPGRLTSAHPIAVIGGGEATAEQASAAYAIGKGLAERNLALICGGRGGVMEAACQGASDAGGLAVAVLPGADPDAANAYAGLVITTDLGNAAEAAIDGREDFSRNRIIVCAAACVIAVGGQSGTANEIKLALRFGKQVFGLCGSPEPEDKGSIDADVRRRLYRYVADPAAALAGVDQVLGSADGG